MPMMQKMKYYLSAGYLKEQGVLDISYYKRYNFRVNLENQVRKWLTVSANISYSDYTSNGGGAMGTGTQKWRRRVNSLLRLQSFYTIFGLPTD